MAEQHLKLNIDLDSLNTKLGATIAKLNETKQSSKEWGETQQKATAKAIDSTDEMQKAVSEVNKEIKAADKNTSSYKSELEQLTETYDKLVNKQKAYVKSGKDLKPLAKQMKVVKDRIKEIDKQQEKLNNKSLTAFERGKKFASNITNIFKGFIALQIVGKVVEFGQALKENIELTEKQRKSLAALANLQGQSLDGATARAKALSETFGLDFDSVLLSVNAQAVQMGISFEDSLSKAEQALTRGKVDAQEYLEVIKEYPTFLKRAGVEGEALNEILELGFSSSNTSDRVFATLEEGTQRLGEFTESTESALLQAFGEGFTSQLKENIDNETITIIEAMQTISEKITDTDLTEQQLSTVLTDVFGGAGEGTLEFIESLQGLDGQLDELNDTQKRYADRQKAVNEANKQLSESQIELSNLFGESANDFNTFILQVQAVGLKAFVEIAKTVKSNLLPSIQKLQTVWVSIGEKLGLVSKDSTFLNTVFEGTVKVSKFLVGTLSLLFDGLGAVANGFVWVYDNVTPIRWALDNTAKGIDNLTETVINLPNIIRGGLNAAITVFQGFGDAVDTTLTNAKNKVLNFFNFGSGETGGLFDGFSKLGTDAVQAFDSAFVEELSKTDLKKQLEAKLKDLEADRKDLKLLGVDKDSLAVIDSAIKETKQSIELLNYEIDEANGKNIKPKTPPNANTGDLRASQGIDLKSVEEQKKLRQQQIKAAEKHKQELIKIEQSLNDELAKIQSDIEQTEINNLADGEEKFNRIKAVNEREISALEANIKAQQELLLSEGQITTEKAIELEQQRNSLIAALRTENNREYLESIKGFNEEQTKAIEQKLEKEQQLELEAIDKQNELKQSRVKASADYLDEEGKATKEGQQKLLDLDIEFLEAKIAFYEGLTAIQAAALGLDENEIETLVNNLRSQINAVKGEINNLGKEDDKDFDLLGLFGIDGDKEKAAVTQIAGIFGGLISESIDNQLKESEKLIEAIDKEIEAQRDKLENHKELEEEGLSFDLENEEKRLEELEGQREKALKKQAQAQKKKAAIQAAEQAGALITSGANLFQSLSGLPLGIGVAAAIGLIAQMYSVFSNFKKQVSTDIPKFRHGTESVQGGIEGQDSVLAYLMPKEAVLPVHIATEHQNLVRGLLKNDKAEIEKGIEKLQTEYNIPPIFNYSVPKFQTPNFESATNKHQETRRQIEAVNNEEIAQQILKLQNNEKKDRQLEEIANDIKQLVKQGNTTIVPEKAVIIEKVGNTINKIKSGDETETDKLLKDILEQLKK